MESFKEGCIRYSAIINCMLDDPMYKASDSMFRDSSEWYLPEEHEDKVTWASHEQRAEQFASVLVNPEGPIKDCSDYKYRAMRNAHLYIELQDELKKLIDDNENSGNTGHCFRHACGELIDGLKNLLRLRKD